MTVTTTVRPIPPQPKSPVAGGGPTMWWGSITPDQQGMDDFSLMYDSEPLTAALEILGRPVAKLHASNCPSCQLVKSARRNLKNQ